MNPNFPDLAEPGTTPQNAVQRFFDEDVAEFLSVMQAIETYATAARGPQPGDELHQRVADAFQRSQDSCRLLEQTLDDPAVLSQTQERFRRATDHWFRQSWIGERARSKPSGFPGDYEMLIKLYERQTPAEGVGAYLDFCIQELPLARAVRARMDCARQFLLEEVGKRSETVRILDVACGPCREFEDWPSLSADVEVIAMDTDPRAIQYLQDEVVPRLNSGVHLRPERYNALRTRSASANVRKFGKFDIIYSVGLCDYLPDEHLVGLLSAWRETLADNGTMYVAFKDTNYYDKTPYQWHLDWFFFQRTPEDVLDLYDAAGFDMQDLDISRDDTGIIVNVFYRRPSKNIRLDDAHKSGISRPHSMRTRDAKELPH